MSDAVFVRCTFPGIVAVIRFTATIGHGETPGVFILDIAPQPTPPALIGPLTIEFAGNTYTWDDCRAVYASYKRDGSGRVVSLTIEDWRWRWRFGAISGRYNIREPHAANQNDARRILSYTEKSPRELLKLCFEQVGQADSTVDVSLVPDDPRPEIEWDVEPAAQAAASLCDLLGCRIVPMPGNGVKICPLGEGADLPEHPSRTDLNQVLDPPEKPSELAVVGGPILFQVDLELEAVAEETDGEFVLLDDVSYKPAAGWKAAVDHPNFDSSISDVKLRQLARDSVYKTYRFVIPADGLAIPGYTDETGKKIKRVDQIVVLDHQAETEIQHAREVFVRPWLFGAFSGDANMGDDVGEKNLTEPEPITDRDSELAKKTLLPDAGSYDQDRGVLFVGQPLMLADTDGQAIPAKLRYRVAVLIRDEETGAIARYIRKRDYGPPPGSTTQTKAEIIRREEVFYSFVAKYKPDYSDDGVEKRGQTAADQEADYYLDQREKEWQTLTPSEAAYGWIIPLVLDGAIQHVVYSGGVDSPATTRISRNTEMKKYKTPYKEQRRNEQVKALLAREAQRFRNRGTGGFDPNRDR